MMYTLKTSSLFRPSSRPSSPHPVQASLPNGDSEFPAERAARPTSKLSLTSFRKPSPSPLLPTAQAMFVQDGSYLEALGLRLSEAVTRALVQPTAASGTNPAEVLSGKRPIPAGRGRALGSVITSELNASKGNVHLQRAILRSLQKPLSVLLTNLSTQLLPLLSSPLFLNPPAPTVANPNLNATQTHALAVANFAGELLDVLDELDLGRVHDARGDGLNNLRDGLVSLIGRVVNPLVAGLKNEITPILQALEEPAQPTSITSIVAKTPGAKFVTQQHPSIMTLQALMPAFSKALTRYTVSSCCQTTLATLLISIVWRAIISLAYRPTPPRSRANSATSSVAASAATRKRLGTSTTPPTTPPASRFTMKLPSSRPPSPISVVTPTTAADARVVYDLLSTLPKPSPSNDVNKVAREAVDEAFEALAALGALLAAIENQEGPDVREDFDLELLTDGLPVLIALPVLLRWAGHGEPHVIPTMIGIAESEYRESCLSGFGRAEECASVVIQRMLDVLGSEESTDDARSRILVQFLESNKDGSD